MSVEVNSCNSVKGFESFLPLNNERQKQTSFLNENASQTYFVQKRELSYN